MLCVVFGLALAGAAVASEDTQVEYPYCFRFTWIGPYQDKQHIAGLTCEHLREDFKNVPCRRPLVATDNDAIPDTIDLWRQYHKQPNTFGCPLVPGEACVKYTYTYNKGVQNITYMCAKSNATYGCYRQKFISGLEVEVCLCKSELGHVPCNHATISMHNLLKSDILWLILGGFSLIWL
uniref:Phosphatidylserine decarboxylase proenzyme n=1 Tax=Zeugodacus cucurbitae TaxID=28588 RepID=A0A0A1XP70_ZEUCU